MELEPGDDQLMAHSAAEGEPRNYSFQLKNILVPIDFSEFSQKALAHAVPLAEKFGAKITLVHVVEPSIYPETLLVSPEREEMNIQFTVDGRNLLETLRREKIDPAIPSDAIVLVGRPYAQIIEAAQSKNADLIVIATHGYTGLKHVLLGSTAERVVRHATCPVLTVRERET
jgi:nucleotide-binding universal stress UspA family protein